MLIWSFQLAVIKAHKKFEDYIVMYEWRVTLDDLVNITECLYKFNMHIYIYIYTYI